jgi:hypothetical protein
MVGTRPADEAHRRSSARAPAAGLHPATAEPKSLDKTTLAKIGLVVRSSSKLRQLTNYLVPAKYDQGMPGGRALRAFEALLPPSADVEVVEEQDGDVLVSVAGKRLRLRWLSVGWPRQVEQPLLRKPRPDILLAPQFSPGARTRASQSQVGWGDETGAAEIAHGMLLISRTGNPATPLGTRLGWRAATLAVCEVLLTGCPATVSAVSQATGLAVSTTAGSLKFLDIKGLLGTYAARGPLSHRYIADSGALLEAYAAAAERLRSPISVRVGVLWRDPIKDVVEMGRSWHDNDLSWAVTSALSAAVLAPNLTQVAPLEVYVTGRTPGDLRRAASIVGLREIEGGRLLLRPFPTPANGAVTEQIEPGLMSVLWPRVYADLRTTGVRGEDAAEHLREEMSRARG